MALLENTVKLLSQRSQLLETKAEMLKEQSVRPTGGFCRVAGPSSILNILASYLIVVLSVRTRQKNETSVSFLHMDKIIGVHL